MARYEITFEYETGMTKNVVKDMVETVFTNMSGEVEVKRLE